MSEVESTFRDATPRVLKAGEPRAGLEWERNFLDMRAGGERWVFLPPKLAFGQRGIPGVVPPILHLELVSIGSDLASSNSQAK